MLKKILVILLLSFSAWVTAATTSISADAPILVLGDSLSSAHHIAADSGWVHLLELRLKQTGASHRTVINASISGETTSGGLARLPQLLGEHKPTLVVVELGANDGLRGLPLGAVKANLTQMLTLIRSSGARIALIGIELPINYGPQYRDGLRDMYRGLAAEFNAPLVPFLLDGVALDPDLMQDDGLHPKAEGEPRVLENVWKVLEPTFKALH
jgi:acyl-CoA thioesterase I